MTSNRYITILILLIVCLTGTFIRYSAAAKHLFPEGDEGPWLRMTARAGTDDFLMSNVAEHDLYGQRVLPHPEDNRSPLFPLLLRAGTLFTDNIFRGAQSVNILLFFVCLFICGTFLIKIFDKRETILYMVFVNLSPIFIINTAHIYNDVTISFCFLFGLTAADTITDSKVKSFFFGCACGLFFLMKISAVFILPVLFFAFINSSKTKKHVFISMISFLLPFLLLSIPWMYRNIYHFGSPFHQFTGYAMWTDSLQEVFSVNIPKPSFTSYVSDHGIIFTFFTRPLIGFKNLLTEILTHDHRLTIFLLPFLPIGICRKKHLLWFHRNIIIFSIPYLALMSFVAYGFWVDRYILVYYLYIFLFAAAGMVTVADYLSHLLLKKFSTAVMVIPHRHIIIQTVILFILFLFPLSQVAYPLEYYLSHRGSEKSRDTDARIIIDTLRPLVTGDESVLSSFLSGYSFLHDIRTVNTIQIGNAENFALLKNAYTINYALLDTVTDAKLLQVLPQWIADDKLIKIAQKGAFVLYLIGTVQKNDSSTSHQHGCQRSFSAVIVTDKS